MSRVFNDPGRIPKEKQKRKINQSTWRKDLSDAFKESLNITKSLRNTGNSSEEIFRVQISFLMSLYDYTIHEVIKYKAVDMYSGIEVEAEKYKYFRVSMKTLQKAIKFPDEPIKWLTSELEFQNDKISYINPRRTLEALELITDVNIFEQYCQEEGFDYDSFFKELENLTFRRNEIVHKMDIKNKLNLERNEITMNEVDNYISIIEKLVLYIIAKI